MKQTHLKTSLFTFLFSTLFLFAQNSSAQSIKNLIHSQSFQQLLNIAYPEVNFNKIEKIEYKTTELLENGYDAMGWNPAQCINSERYKGRMRIETIKQLAKVDFKLKVQTIPNKKQFKQFHIFQRSLSKESAGATYIVVLSNAPLNYDDHDGTYNFCLGFKNNFAFHVLSAANLDDASIIFVKDSKDLESEVKPILAKYSQTKEK